MGTLQTDFNPKGRIFTKKRLIWLAVILAILIVSTIVSISVYVGLSLVKPERKVIHVTPSDYEMPIYENVSFYNKIDNTLLHGGKSPHLV